MRILVAYQSTGGHTADVAARIGDVLRKGGALVDVSDVEDAPAPHRYDGVVVGDSIHRMHHSGALRSYLGSHAKALNVLTSALFQVSLTTSVHDARHDARAHAFVQDLLDETGFDPDLVGLFAGDLTYTRYGWLKRRMMRAIAHREGGETGVTRDYDHTDWEAVDQFAEDVLAAVLSTAAETRAVVEPDVTVRDVPPGPAATVDITTTGARTGEAFGQAFGEIAIFLDEHRLTPAGPGFAIYTDFEMPMTPGTAEVWHVTLGVPLAAPLPEPEGAAAGTAVGPGEVPSGRVAVTTHVGPYATLGQAWARLEAWTEREGYLPAGPPWESYLVEDSTEPDPDRWRTEVCWPVT